MAEKNSDFVPPEILAPAGDYDSLLAAIKGRADAVYLGVGDFNARQGAKNFTLEELETAVDLAHSHGVSVHLALNIPLKQKELQKALNIIDRAYAVGIDAVILQDLGLLTLLSKIYPDLPLHASTQMTIHNKAGVDFATELGAKRVIISRELSAGEVKSLVEHSKTEIEIFVHGALCYSYSGKCLFSSFRYGRSANRGACAQPCRRRYKFVVDGKEVDERYAGGNYPISCAELCTLSGLEELIKTGVVSLKIEGRMKKPEYVTACAAAYKTAVESISSPGEKPTKEELKAKEVELAKLFYRGFTKGFILGEKGVSHPKYSSNYGVFLGKVLELSSSRGSTELTVNLKQDIHIKDGISIFTRERMLGSAVTRIITSEGKRIKSAKKGEKVGLEISSKTGKAVRRGDELYITTDTLLLETLRNAKLKSLPVTLRIKARAGEQFYVEIEDKNGNIAEFTDEYIVQKAQKTATTEEQIRKAMTSLGDTPFEANSPLIEADENIFVPVGVLKNARRKTAGMLLEKRLQAYKKEQKHPDLENFSYLCSAESEKDREEKASSTNDFLDNYSLDNDSSVKTLYANDFSANNLSDKNLLLSVEVQDIPALFLAAGAGADIVYLPILHFEELRAPANAEKLETLKARGTELVFLIPEITHDCELEELKPLLGKIKDADFSVACSSLGAAQFAKSFSLPFVAQKELNIFNAYSATAFSRAGAYRVTLSSELNLSEIKNVCEALKTSGEPEQLEILVHGRELLLITENDLLKPLIDRKIVRKNSDVCLLDQEVLSFPVKRQGSRTRIYNSKVLNMLKYAKDLKKYGVDVLRLDLSLNNEKEIPEIIEAYKKALLGKDAKLKPGKSVEYTTGHYFKLNRSSKND